MEAKKKFTRSERIMFAPASYNLHIVSGWVRIEGGRGGLHGHFVDMVSGQESLRVYRLSQF